MGGSQWQRRVVTVTTSSEESIRLNYIDSCSALSTDQKEIILLIHGFPQTSHQFRHVIDPLSQAGYRVIVPDYRGAGQSSKPVGGYEKSQMAEDLHLLIHSHLGIKQKIHVVGHDIGGMIAYSYASRYANDVASVTWGECPLPGSEIYEQVKGTPDVFHFLFHQVQDLPEALIAGREEIYIKHFFDKQLYNTGAITQEDLDCYVLAYSQPGAIRAGLNVYRALEKDSQENRDWVAKHGKCGVPALGLAGKQFLVAPHMEKMLKAVHEDPEIVLIDESGHYVAEENPKAFVDVLLQFVSKHKVAR
ncbi:Alpha/Beta hydrolase protein [Clohesyomyces aquaticus]|uniref:Alpha/Beta hydrolase protein n=1 Tax=Clohesyomyces aquaticus TaxID=1231657 RepID=A0A1Y1ZK88_9PLEO|nr:Alpha/Beta hydrolase protein [Clohesyomyces aquaticus]